jgi:type I restriction enzyme S subunit
MSFSRYPAYKPSGVEWLGEVPEHWDVLPCRGIVDERNEKNEGAACQDYLSLMANVGIIPYEEKGDVGNKKPEDLGKCKLVRKGDFVINSMNYGIGSYGVSGYDGVCSPVYIVLIPKEEEVKPGFAFRIFEDKTFQSHAQSFGNGILAHRCAIGWDILKGIGVPVPSSHEQERILQFLDHETAKIDALIAEQQRLIELLQEKRQAVISQAVTRGLNPEAPMKDSGVEWLGEVPEHWEVQKVKHLCRHIEQGWSPQCENEASEGDAPGVLKVGCVNGGIFRPGENKRLPPDLSPIPEYSLRKGDLLISRANTKELVGSAAVVSEDYPWLFICDKLYRITVDPSLASAAFLALYLGSSEVRGQIELGASGASQSMQNISQSVLMELPIALPDLDEQEAIQNAIANECCSIDELVAEGSRAISLLQERRSALISAAVTGQIDVRGLVPEAEAA